MARIKDRFKKMGRATGAELELTFLAIPEERRKVYVEEFFRELGRISMEERKEGEPPLEGVYELEGLDLSQLDLVNNPINLARVEKERLHGNFSVINKRNSLRGFYGHFGMTAPFDIQEDDYKDTESSTHHQ